MYTIWFIVKESNGYHKVEFRDLDTAQIVWDILNSNDKVAMRSTRP